MEINIMLLAYWLGLLIGQLKSQLINGSDVLVYFKLI